MSHAPQFALLTRRRFLPLFITQAIGAFNDNAFRFALSMLFIYELGPKGWNGALLNTISGGLLVLPFFFFSATAGQLADKYDKAVLIRRIKLIEIGIIALASASLFMDTVYLQLFCVFLTGTQSAFFGPVKLSIIPQQLKPDEVLAGNGLVEMGTFIAILLGTMFGSYFIIGGQGRLGVSIVMIGLAVVAWGSSLLIPPAPPPRPDLKIEPNFLAETVRTVRRSAEDKAVFWPILGISWFWVLGAVYLTQIPSLAEHDLLGDPRVANVIVAVFTVATGFGSVIVNRLLKGEVTAWLCGPALLVVSLFTIDLWFASHSSSLVSPLTTQALVTTLAGWRILVDLFLVAVAAGIYVVPLFALLQERAPEAVRSRIVAGNNIMNAIFMTLATVVAAIIIALGFSAVDVLLIMALVNFIAIFLAFRASAGRIIIAILRFVFRVFFRARIAGIENIAAAGPRAVIVPNHQSLLDGGLLIAFLPPGTAFAVNTFAARAWWLSPFLKQLNIVTVDPTNPLALRALIKEVAADKSIVIFPEGRLSVTGSLMKIYEGAAVIAQMADAKLVPARIAGTELSRQTHLQGKVRQRWFPKVSLTFLPPVSVRSPEGLTGQAQRTFLSDGLSSVMTGMIFATSPIRETLLAGLLRARDRQGADHIILEDVKRKPLTYKTVVAGIIILARKFASLVGSEKNVGLLLPNSSATFLSFMALQAVGRVPAMFNFSTGAKNMALACDLAKIKTIISSRAFIEAGQMEETVALLSEKVRFLWLEDIGETVTRTDRLRALMNQGDPMRTFARMGYNSDPEQPAVLLFTSGSEGTPKGVALSHVNLQANRYQAAARINFAGNDIMFNALPMFHAFGLTVGTLLPVLSGVRTFLYPSPLHYKIVPELCYDACATIILGTDTFLAGYGKNASAYDFFSVRLVVAGAERVRPETRKVWMEKFGIRLLEGYGATECAPTLAFNTPMYFRDGTVGRLFDGIEARLEPVPGVSEGGRLHVKGPNIMLGYLQASGEILKPPDGWYDTGDIVSMDDRAFITILGRAKRFEKVAGEMVSLAAVEVALQAYMPDGQHGVVAIEDAKKGEQLVLFTTHEGLDRAGLAKLLKAAGVTDIAVPRTIHILDSLPLLGSGKFDYITMKRLALEAAQDAKAAQPASEPE